MLKMAPVDPGRSDFHGVKCTIFMGPWENKVVQFFSIKIASLFLWACLSMFTSTIMLTVASRNM